MSNTVQYASDSISDILNDTPYRTEGSVLNDEIYKRLRISKQSSIGFKYEFSVEDKLIMPSLRIAFHIDDATRYGSSLYRPNLHVKVSIHYYLPDLSSEGIWQVIDLLPMLYKESNYLGYAEAELEDNLYIAEIYLELINLNWEQVDFAYLNLYRGMNVSQVIEQNPTGEGFDLASTFAIGYKNTSLLEKADYLQSNEVASKFTIGHKDTSLLEKADNPQSNEVASDFTIIMEAKEWER